VFKSTLQPHNAAAIGGQPAPGASETAVAGDADEKANATDEKDYAYDNDDPDRAKENGWEKDRFVFEKFSLRNREKCPHRMCGGGPCKAALKRKQSLEADIDVPTEEDVQAMQKRLANGGATKEQVDDFWSSLQLRPKRRRSEAEK